MKLISMNFTICCLLCSGYEEEAVDVFEPLLKFLPQLTYENMQTILDISRNITENEIYRRAMEKRSLRSLVFQVNIYSNK